MSPSNASGESHVTMEQLVSLAKRRGFVYAGSEIYGGLANAWDYGPLGVELKNNLKRWWWKHFVQSRSDIEGIDSAILMNPKIWEASGHVGNFSDPLVDCRQCKSRHRADHLLEKHHKKHGGEQPPLSSDLHILQTALENAHIPCPTCGVVNYTKARQFNLMFKTFLGPTEESGTEVYLRPETAQGIFVNFRNVQTTSRQKLPFGIGQIGKSFRNEITPGNFVFRTREFEQMELEFFCDEAEAAQWYARWIDDCQAWLAQLGLSKDRLRLRAHNAEELSHYSAATSDIEYHFPFGWGELWGIANRGCYDLTQHQSASGKELAYHDNDPSGTPRTIMPHVIEPALGADRLFLAVLGDAYHSEEVDGETRLVLRLHPRLSPYQVAVLPLSKKLEEAAQQCLNTLSDQFVCDYDVSGSIGRRYRRQDEIGTPYCITIDFDTLTDQAVTVRDRDSMKQQRVSIDQLDTWLYQQLYKFNL